MQLFCEQTGVLPVRNDLVDAQLNFTTRNDLMPVFQKQATTLPDKPGQDRHAARVPGDQPGADRQHGPVLVEPAAASVDSVIAGLTTGIDKA